jgi:hypothetical protein
LSRLTFHEGTQREAGKPEGIYEIGYNITKLYQISEKFEAGDGTNKNMMHRRVAA